MVDSSKAAKESVSMVTKTRLDEPSDENNFWEYLGAGEIFSPNCYCDF